MSQTIHPLDSDADPTVAARWLRKTIRSIGPGFHSDTAPHEYVDEGGKPAFSPADGERLACGLELAAAVLGREAFEDLCLRQIWSGLGVRYDPAQDCLVSVGT